MTTRLFYVFMTTRLFYVLTACIIVAQSSAFAQSTSSVRDDGTILVNGQPFFPFGLYNPTQSDLAVLKAGDFNTAINYEGPERGAPYTAYLDEADRQGIKVLGFWRDNTTPTFFRDHPAVLGWALHDDINNLEPSIFLRDYESVKAWDPNHIAYTSGWRIVDIGNYVDKIDVLGMQPYHIPIMRTWMSSPGPDMSFSFHMIHETLKAAEAKGVKKLAVIGNTQIFEWWQNANDRYPTVPELTNMVYSQIIAGAKGIIPYTMLECCAGAKAGTGTLAANHPELWTELIRIRKEVKTFEGALLNGKRTTTIEDPSEYSVFSAYWEFENRVYVAIANTSGGTKSVSVELPAGTTGGLQPLFMDRPSGMSISNGAVVGSINSTDVHIYVIGGSGVLPTPTPLTTTTPLTTPTALPTNIPGVTPSALPTEVPDDTADDATIDLKNVRSFGRGFDLGGDVAVSSDGSGITIKGAAWKAFEINGTLTGESVVSFDVNISQIGAIHGVGLDTDLVLQNSKTNESFTKLAGKSSRFARFASIKDSNIEAGVWYRVQLPVSKNLANKKLFFVIVNDSNRRSASEMVIENVRFEKSDVPLEGPVVETLDEAPPVNDGTECSLQGQCSRIRGKKDAIQCSVNAGLKQNGTGMSGATVEIKARDNELNNWKDVGNSTTDDNGQAKITFQLDQQKVRVRVPQAEASFPSDDCSIQLDLKMK